MLHLSLVHYSNDFDATVKCMLTFFLEACSEGAIITDNLKSVMFDRMHIPQGSPPFPHPAQGRQKLVHGKKMQAACE